MPGVSVVRTSGHSGGHQAIIVRGPDGTVGFIGDLFMRPWGANPRWVSAFDDYPLTSVAVKADLFRAGRRGGLDGRPVPRATEARWAASSPIATASGSSRSSRESTIRGRVPARLAAADEAAGEAPGMMVVSSSSAARSGRAGRSGRRG